jgi:predicted phosphodiesterase
LLLWVLSDLHIELTRGWDFPSAEMRPHYDVLVVAGDLIPRMERGVKWLRDRVTDRPVIYIAGNHEAYGCDINRTIEKAKEAARGTNVFVLEQDTVQLGNVTFAGATTWTDFDLFGDPHRAMKVAGEKMNDFRKIRIARYAQRFLPHHALGRHTRARTFLETEMRRARNGPLVIVTHHAPILGRDAHLFDQPHRTKLTDDDVLTAAYRSDLSALMQPAALNAGGQSQQPADVWIYGHTHESIDVKVGQTRVITNAKGYGPWPPSQRMWDNSTFDPMLVVEI